jgi:glutathione S-transferase
MSSLRLVSFHICPFVQRSTIALEEKGVPYEIEFIDLSDKPDWFLKLSPHGKVPLLQVDDTVLFESTVILEYLDETHEPQLHCADPLKKARDRAWFSVADAATGSAFRMMIAKSREELAEHCEAVQGQLAKLEAEVEGPLWRGEGFTAMDAVTFPALQRLIWLQELYPELKVFADTPKVLAWVTALQGRPAIQRSSVPDLKERFLVALEGYSPMHKATRSA